MPEILTWGLVLVGGLGGLTGWALPLVSRRGLLRARHPILICGIRGSAPPYPPEFRLYRLSVQSDGAPRARSLLGWEPGIAFPLGRLTVLDSRPTTARDPLPWLVSLRSDLIHLACLDGAGRRVDLSIDSEIAGDARRLLLGQPHRPARSAPDAHVRPLPATAIQPTPALSTRAVRRQRQPGPGAVVERQRRWPWLRGVPLPALLSFVVAGLVAIWVADSPTRLGRLEAFGLVAAPVLVGLLVVQERVRRRRRGLASGYRAHRHGGFEPGMHRGVPTGPELLTVHGQQLSRVQAVVARRARMEGWRVTGDRDHASELGETVRGTIWTVPAMRRLIVRQVLQPRYTWLLAVGLAVIFGPVWWSAVVVSTGPAGTAPATIVRTDNGWRGVIPDPVADQVEVRFVADGREMRTRVGSVHTGPGKAVRVEYALDDPERATLAGWWAARRRSVVTACFGCCPWFGSVSPAWMRCCARCASTGWCGPAPACGAATRSPSTNEIGSRCWCSEPARIRRRKQSSRCQVVLPNCRSRSPVRSSCGVSGAAVPSYRSIMRRCSGQPVRPGRPSPVWWPRWSTGGSRQAMRLTMPNPS